MHLLTWQGSVVCVPGVDGDLTQAPLSAESGQIPMQFEASAFAAHGGSLRHPDLGSVRMEPAVRAGFFHLQRDGMYLSATPHSIVLGFDREHALLWETFLPVSADDLNDLIHILAYPWIERLTRRVVPRRKLSVTDFALRLGDASIGLADGLEASVSRRNAAGKPVALRAHHGAPTMEQVIAQPRSSALLTTALWPVRARRSAEVLALAVHRQLIGTEPEQDVFEQITAALQSKGGAPGLSDVLEEILADVSLTRPEALDALGRSELVRSRSVAEAAGTRIAAHLQNLGDVDGDLDEWIGVPRSGHGMEGFAILPGETLNADGLSYQAVLENGDLTEAAPAGEYCGTRGMSQRIYGVCIAAEGAFATSYKVLCEAVFTDGTALEPVEAGVVCQAPSGAPLEAMRVTIVARPDSKA
jgi:hypothetical protein